MDKSFIEKRITEKAQVNLRQELQDAKQAITKNVILDNIKIKVGEEEYWLSNIVNESSSLAGITNFSEVIKKREEKLVQQETDSLLNQLGSLQEFLAENLNREY